MTANVKSTPRTEVAVSSTKTAFTGSQSSYTIVRSFSERYMAGENIRNFHQRRRRGDLLPHTDFFQYETDGSASRTEDLVRTSDSAVIGWSNGAYYPTSKWAIEQPALIDGYAPDGLTSLLKDVTGRINSGGVNIGNMLGELGRTTQMIRNIGKTALSLTSGKSSREIADLYLQGRYGWAPLVRDIKDLVDAVRRIEEKDVTRHSQRLGFTTTRTIAPSYEDCFTGSYYNGCWGYDDKLEISSRASITADIEVSLFRINPFVTAWELVPFSFVVDWLLDIGSSIEAASFLFSTKGHASSVGYNIQLTRTPFMSIDLKPGYTGTSTVSGSSTCLVQRRIPSSVSISPRFRPRLRPIHVLDSLALLRQRVG